MLKGQLTYRAPVSGDRLIAFSPLKVTTTQPGVAKIEVSAPKTGDSRACAIQVTIDFSSVASREEAGLMGWQITKDILDRIAFDQAIAVDNPAAPAGYLTPVGSDGAEGVPSSAFDSVTCFMTGHVLMEPSEQELLRLAKRLNARRLKGRTYYPLLRSALTSDNPVEKYLALCRILLVIHDDKQQELDKFLNDKFGDQLKPRPGQKPKPGKSPIKETEFTKLRNEFAHIRKRTRLEITRQQMEHCMDRLIERVKWAIQNKG